MNYKGATVIYTYVGEPITFEYLTRGYISFRDTKFDVELKNDDFEVPDDEILFYSSLKELNAVFLKKEPLGDIIIHKFELV